MVSTVPSLLRSLPRSARQALPIIERGIREGLSSRALTSIIREAGIPISRTSVLRATRALRGETLTITDIKLQPRDVPFDVNRLPTSLTRIRRELSFRVAVRGIDANGQPVERHVTVATDDASKTLDDILSEAEQYVSDPTDYGLAEVQEIEVIGAKRRFAS